MFLELADTLKDELTQLYNRHFLEFIIPKELKKCRRYGTKFSILLIDLDDFNLVNTLYGHSEGDRILFEFAQFLKNTMRETDSLVRLSGDEFVAILPHTSMENARMAAERVIAYLKDKEFSGIKLSCSIAIAEAPTHGLDWNTLHSRLDTAMFKAKKMGKGNLYLLPHDENVFPIIPAPLLIARSSEKSLLLQKIKTSGSPLILLYGPTGVGKSRLLSETVKDLSTYMSIMAHCGGGITNIPFFPFRILLKKAKEINLFNYNTAIETLEENEKVALSLLAPEVGYIPENVDRYRFFDSFSKFLSNLTKNQSILFILDDAQWGDSSTFELLFYLIHSEISGLKTILAVRKEEVCGKPIENFLSHLTRERLVDEMQLGEFDKDETFEFIETILQGKCQESLKELIFLKSGGNPFFIEEVIKELYKNDLIVYKIDQWSLTPGKAIYVPESIEHIVKERLKSFEDDRILGIIACLGNEFNVKTLELLVNTNPGEIYDTIDKLVKFNILFEKSVDVFGFKEDVTREIILSNISETKRRFIHKNILNILEKYPQITRANEELLSYHSYYAGEIEKVKEYSLKAARNLRSIFAYEEAMKHYKWYLEVEEDDAEKIRVFIEYIDVLTTYGELQVAIDEIKGMLENKNFNDEVFCKLSEVYTQFGNLKEALNSINAAINIKYKPYYELRKAWILLLSGKIAEADKIITSLGEHENLLDERERALYYNCQAFLLTEQEDFEKAEDRFEKALLLRQQQNDNKGVANIYLNLGNMLLNKGDFEKALQNYENALEIYSNIGDKRGILSALNNMTNVLSRLKQYEKAINAAKNAIRIGRQIGARRAVAMALTNCASTLLKIGVSSEAETMLNEALAIAKELGEELPLIHIYQNMLELCSHSPSNNNFAMEIADNLLSIIDKVSVKVTISSAILQIAETFLFFNHFERAKEILKKYSDLLSTEKSTELLTKFLMLKATTDYLSRDFPGFRDALKKLSNMKKTFTESMKDYYFECYAFLLYFTGKMDGATKVMSCLINKAKTKGLEEESLRLSLTMERISRPLRSL